MKATKDEANYGVIMRIIRMCDAPWSRPSNAPDAHTVVVHLRIGDVIEDGWTGTTGHSVQQLLTGKLEICNGNVPSHGDRDRRCYIHNLDYFRRQVDKIPRAAKINRAVLCAGSHMSEQGRFHRSSKYIRGRRV